MRVVHFGLLGGRQDGKGDVCIRKVDIPTDALLGADGVFRRSLSLLFEIC